MLKRTLILFYLLAIAIGNFADDFVDDLYYEPKKELRKSLNNKQLTPRYNKMAKEIVFIEDTMLQQHPDTVRAIIQYLVSDQ